MSEWHERYPLVRCRTGVLSERDRKYVDPAGLERMARWGAEKGGATPEAPDPPRRRARDEDAGLPPPPICAPRTEGWA